MLKLLLSTSRSSSAGGRYNISTAKCCETLVLAGTSSSLILLLNMDFLAARRCSIFKETSASSMSHTRLANAAVTAPVDDFVTALVVTGDILLTRVKVVTQIIAAPGSLDTALASLHQVTHVQERRPGWRQTICTCTEQFPRKGCRSNNSGFGDCV